MIILLLALALPSAHGTLLSDKDSESSKSDLVDVVDEIISNSFKTDASTINFIVSLSDETKRKQSDLINNLAALCDVVYLEDVEFIIRRHRLFNLIFIEDLDSFLKLSRRLLSDNFVIDGVYLFILVNGMFEELPEVSRLLWKSFIRKVNFVFETESGASLMSFKPFSKDKNQTKCDDSTPYIVKTFNGTYEDKKNYFPVKISDMSRCPVKVVTFNTPPMMMIQYDNERNYKLKGVDGEMLKLLSEIFNFKIDLIHISDLIRLVLTLSV